MPTTSKTINAHLLSLLPSYATATLPPALVDLTASLCATSRARAGHLKGEEELSREYICAYMAIDRLKGRLNLPEADTKPPVPPRTFARLLAMFEKLMPMSSSSVAAAAAGQVGTSSSQGATLRRPAGKKRKAAANSAAVSSSARFSAESVAHWAEEYLTDLKIAVDAPIGFVDAAMAGLQAVFPDFQRVPLPAPVFVPTNATGQALQEQLAKTLVVVALLTLPKLGKDVPVRDTTRAAVKELIVRRIVAMAQFGRIVSESEKMLEERGPTWMTMGWWTRLNPTNRGSAPPGPETIEELSGPLPNAQVRVMVPSPRATIKFASMEGVEMTDTSEDTPLRELPRTIPGSMRLARTDWLSSERREDYSSWKADIMRRVHLVESERVQ